MLLNQAEATVLIIDDDPGVIVSLGKALRGLAHTVFSTSGKDALERVRALSPPNLILLDMNLPDISGLSVCKTLKANPITTDIPVIFITSNIETGFEEMVFEAGAADYIAKPLNPRVVSARVKTQLGFRQALAQLREIATHDGLTGLHNRRCFDERFKQEWQRARRTGGTLALLIIDIDDFKKYNDHFGHLQGDVCLRTVANLLLENSQRSSDFVARYGGEEFVVLLPDTSEEGALSVAQALIAAIQQANIVHAPNASHPVVTISIGCSVNSPARSSAEHLDVNAIFEIADSALYEAKHLGRNRVVVK